MGELRKKIHLAIYTSRDDRKFIFYLCWIVCHGLTIITIITVVIIIVFGTITIINPHCPLLHSLAVMGKEVRIRILFPLCFLVRYSQ